MLRIAPASPAQELATLRNIGPRSAAWLAEVGIKSRDDLALHGSIECCRLLMQAGRPVSRNMAYAIEGALMNRDWRTIPIEFRKQIAADFEQLKREFAKQ